MPMITIRMLDDSIKAVLGEDRYDALLQSGAGRVGMHETACLSAFANERADRHVDVLRAMLVQLKRKGEYPREAWTGEEDEHTLGHVLRR